MKALRLLTILGACCAFGTTTPSVWAAEPAPARPAIPAATPPAKPANESAAAETDEQSSAAQPSAKAEGTQGKDEEAAAGQPRAAAKPKAPGKGSPERFVPSEQVRADFDVSFPIDI